MLPDKLAFVDIETTGARSRYDRIIEIGILRVENDQIVQTYSSLVNPQRYIPTEIELLTGITSDEIEQSPTFREIADDVLAILKETVFVAHNVRFDYGFLKAEFKRLNKTFSTKHFCTVRLSRVLFPQFTHHNLDSIIKRFNIRCDRRHRALDDAKAIFQFYKLLKESYSQEVFLKAIEQTLRKPYLPPKIDERILENLPEGPGIYIFYGSKPDNPSTNTINNQIDKKLRKTNNTKNLVPLYIGKSINIKERVLAHFASDIYSPLEMKIAQQVESIETIPTAGELGALFLESQLIKKLLPLYNKKLRQKRNMLAIKMQKNEEGFMTVTLESVKTPSVTELDLYVGFFTSKKQARDFLFKIAQEFNLCEKLLGLEKTKTSCFGYRLERCKGACIKKESPLAYNIRFSQAFTKTKIKTWPFSGPIVVVEECDSSEKKEYFIVDKWCIIGHITADSYEAFNEKNLEYAFDLDTYKILLRFLTKNRKITQIKLLPPQIYYQRYSPDK